MSAVAVAAGRLLTEDETSDLRNQMGLAPLPSSIPVGRRRMFVMHLPAPEQRSPRFDAQQIHADCYAVNGETFNARGQQVYLWLEVQ
jgi:hypothetical protein